MAKILNERCESENYLTFSSNFSFDYKQNNKNKNPKGMSPKFSLIDWNKNKFNIKFQYLKVFKV